ncbi:MAG: hypothetical protein CBD88_07560 [Flavobacteriales bacterium TMED228]|nr:MAG: hypothetical protein CBD88_07560 [Flavobacteriales bacterium TMED228]
MSIKFTNNAVTTLSSAISNTATTLPLTDGSTFPALSGSGDYCYVTMQDTISGAIEVVKATARSGNSLTVVRAQEGTTASAFDSGKKVELRITAQGLTDLAEIPTQSGQNGRFLTTDGSTVSWATVQAGFQESKAYFFASF